MKNIFALLVLLLTTSFLYSQDKIIKRSGDILECNVTEISTDEIKYFYSNKVNLIFGIDKSLVERVEFATGEVIEIKANTFLEEEYYSGQNTMAVKIGFLEPLLGHTSFTFEKNIKPGHSWESSLGIIGLGIDNYNYNARGVYTKFAYKFIRTPDFYMNRMHYAHILKGAYIAPEIAMRFMAYESDRYYYDPAYGYPVQNNDRKNIFGFALTLKFGKQWVIDNAFIIDTYTGFGYGIGSDDYDGPFPYGFIAGTSEVPVAFNLGIRLGWSF